MQWSFKETLADRWQVLEPKLPKRGAPTVIPAVWSLAGRGGFQSAGLDLWRSVYSVQALGTVPQYIPWFLLQKGHLKEGS